MEHAYYLTVLIESPYYGTVQSYDGAAMSAGPLHNIAVQPRGLAQGSLFALLRHIELVPAHIPELQDLWAALKMVNWMVAQDGKLRHIQTGTLVDGAAIRNEFTPKNGVVPKVGPLWEQARKWAVFFHKLFAAPATFEAQKQFAIHWLVTTQRDTEDLFYKGKDPKTVDTQGINSLSPEEDLAMCAYHCYSVNAPAPAKTELLASLKAAGTGAGFAKALLKHLGDNGYGNWAIRYARTREAALRTGFWSRDLFEGPAAIFPKK
jgi:hypothetical protein